MTQLEPDLGYAVLLLLVLLTPYWAAGGSRSGTSDVRLRIVELSVLAAAMVLAVIRPGGFPLVTVALLIPLAGLGLRYLLGGAASLLLFVTVTWWTPELVMGPLATASFLLLALVAATQGA